MPREKVNGAEERVPNSRGASELEVFKKLSWWGKIFLE